MRRGQLPAAGIGFARAAGDLRERRPQGRLPRRRREPIRFQWRPTSWRI